MQLHCFIVRIVLLSNHHLSSNNLLQELHWLPIHSCAPLNWLVLPIKRFPLINPFTWGHYWISVHLFEHYAPLISIFLTGHMSAQTLAKKPSHIKLPTSATLPFYQLDIVLPIQPSNAISKPTYSVYSPSLAI